MAAMDDKNNSNNIYKINNCNKKNMFVPFSGSLKVKACSADDIESD